MVIISARYGAPYPWMQMIETVIDEGNGPITYWVPDDMTNRYRIALADWEAEGNVIEPYIPPGE